MWVRMRSRRRWRRKRPVAMAAVNPPLFNSEMIREKARGGERGIQNISSSSSSSCPVFASFFPNQKDLQEAAEAVILSSSSRETKTCSGNVTKYRRSEAAFRLLHLGSLCYRRQMQLCFLTQPQTGFVESNQRPFACQANVLNMTAL